MKHCDQEYFIAPETCFNLISKIVSFPVGVTCVTEQYNALGLSGPKRRSVEHEAGRRLAHGLLRARGIGDKVKRGVAGEPLWPEGITGSISHCDGLVLAAISDKSRRISFGVDVDVVALFEPDLLAIVASDRDELPSILCERQICAAMFSAKEACYKAVFPLQRRFLEFEEMIVRWYGNSNFVARVRGSKFELHGRTEFFREWVVAWAEILVEAGD